MKTKSVTIEQRIKQLLEESKAENEALKKLIAAMQENELRRLETKHESGESSETKKIN
jgi:hypothetical protein